MRMRSFLVLVASVVLAAGGPAAWGQNSPVAVTVDASASRHPIIPEIYGVAHAGAAALADLRVPLNRSGGNNTSRFNLLPNADKRRAHSDLESIPYAIA